MARKFTTEDFIAKANIIHKRIYNYSKVEYVDSKTPVCIICPEHGEFWQESQSHLQGCGCNLCAKIKRKTTKTSKRISYNEAVSKIKKFGNDIPVG